MLEDNGWTIDANALPPNGWWEASPNKTGRYFYLSCESGCFIWAGNPTTDATVLTTVEEVKEFVEFVTTNKFVLLTPKLSQKLPYDTNAYLESYYSYNPYDKKAEYIAEMKTLAMQHGTSAWIATQKSNEDPYKYYKPYLKDVYGEMSKDLDDKMMAIVNKKLKNVMNNNMDYYGNPPEPLCNAY